MEVIHCYYKELFIPQLKNNIIFSNILTPLDWGVFVFILLITIATILYGKKLQTKKDQSFLEILLMGRRLTLPLFIGTLVATWYGGIFGVTQIAFNKGVFNFVTQGVFWYASYILFAFFIVHKIARYKAVTLPDLIEKMFGPKSAKLSAIFNFFNILPITYVISLGIFLQLIVGGPLLLNMSAGVIFVVLYSMWGGFRAVVFSDLVQFFVMCLSVFLILVFSVSTFGGLSFLQSQLPPSYWKLTGGESWSTTIVWGFIALSTLVDPNFYQRCFAAKSPSIAKKGILISTLVWFCFDICTTLGAMYAKAVIPEAESGFAYLTYSLQILPPGTRGLVLAGILATILSTLDSYLFLAGTTLSYDLMPKKWKNKPTVFRIGIVLVGLLAILMATIFDSNIKMVWKTLGSYSAACLLLPVVYGYLFPKKISDNQFFFSCIFGVIVTTYWRNSPHTGFWLNVDELYAGMLATSMGLLLWPKLKKTKTLAL